MNIEQYTSPDAFTALREEWNPLLKRSATDTPFSTWQWHKHWWDAYQPGELRILAIRHESGQLIAIASFFLETDNSGSRNLHFVGCEDVTDYLDLLIDKDHLEAVYATLASYLCEMQDTFDVLDLCNIPEASP
ncbi:MAG: hypothetical protein KC496_11105, partial [Anaerolineae bacterium]|nr:hypothetical protein [Anaerolineae bacterium]